ncbi:family 78 glycoside hydrolase catalytic domain [Demequina sp. NBRC 110056]|uniref:family 78 glycoside hydrolase catalytic domain n=1 Tax=Demequina sp. NBRC 110056 TaxID=1570345 RepID=UPI000A062686|nr:family 78 glycoside hydrolase catalytic domain [Demequina sp. NBRC 110056]
MNSVAVDALPRAILTIAGSRGRSHLGSARPALTWRVETDEVGWRQARAEIRLERDGAVTVAALDGASSVAVAWPFEPLAAYDSVTIAVRVQGASARWGPWSDAVAVRTGPLSGADLRYEFVTAPDSPAAEPDLAAPRPTFRARTTVVVREGLVSASLTTTALGVYDAVIDGTPVSDEVLAPGWTSYDDRVLFQTSDVTAALAPGVHVLGAEVAEGWYGERYGFDGQFARGYDGPLAVLAQLRLEYRDGSIEWIGTDGTWETTWDGPTVSASIYQGERRDDRAADEWLTRGDAKAVGAVRRAVQVAPGVGSLEPAIAPPVRRIETVEPVGIDWSGGNAVVDLGQNLVGWVRLRATAEPGTEVTLRHAEVLDDGVLATRPLRHAAATDTVIVGESGEVEFAPRFTFHGFRYVEIAGLASESDLVSIEAVVVHTDMERTGTWSSSNDLLNQLHSNVVWGMRSNFLSIPTDCPQRDERLGWTGDIQVFAPTAAYLYDCASMLESWLVDLGHEQRRLDGVVPPIVPAPVAAGPALPAAAWGDAATLVPEALYRAFGDAEALEARYEPMVEWVEAVLAAAGDGGLWEGGFQFGDWLDPTAPPFNPADAKTSPDVVASAYLFRSLTAVAAAADLLGREDDAQRYAALADRSREAFLDAYVSPDGRIVSDAHTAYAIAITFGLLEGDPRRHAAGARLAQLVTAHAYRIRTGFVGTPLICDALTLTGHRDVAYRLLLEEGCPSWLYPVTMGATTIWERWDSLQPDGSVNPGEMTSFNHYALGAVADWMHREIGGIEPLAPAYSRVRIAPRPGGGLTSAEASIASPYGRVSCAWRIESGELTVSAEVPPNTVAVIDLPGADVEEVGSGVHQRTVPWSATDEGPARITLDTPLSVLVHDGQAVGTLMGVFAQTGYFIGLGWTDGGKWRPDFSLRNGLPMLKPHQHEALAGALTGLNASRGFHAVEGEWELPGM